MPTTIVVSVDNAVRVDQEVRLVTEDEKEYFFVPEKVSPHTNRRGNLILKAEGTIYIKECGKITQMLTGNLYIGDEESEEDNITLEVK